MSDLRAAAKQMLEALEGGADSWQLVGPAIDALKEALAEPFSPEAISTTQAAWKMGYEARKAEEQAKPEPPPEAQTEAEKIAYCAGWWAALEKARKEEPVQEPEPGEYHGWVLREVLFDNGEPVGHREPVQEPVQESSDMAEQLADALDSAQFYRRRCEAIQAWQSKMRDPERVIVCDILANGKTLDPAVAGDRYTVPRPAEPVQEPVAWVDHRIHGWPDCFVMEADPPHTTPLYTAPPHHPSAPIIKPEIKEDNSVPQAQQFLYSAWAYEQIQKEKK